MSRHEDNRRIPRIAYVVTVGLSTGHFEGQIGFLANNGFQMDVICSPGPRLESMRRKGATPWPIEMKREIAVASDVFSLWRLWRLFRLIRPDIVVAGTPKAGLLGTVAARLAGVPHVEYALLGLRFETAQGIKRSILKCTEWIACHTANSVRCVSPSILARIVALRLAPSARCIVIGNGTSDGIAVGRYAPANKSTLEAEHVRQELMIPHDAPVIGFVGRMTHDKGIHELYDAFKLLQVDHRYLRLLLVGEFEEGDPIPGWLRRRIEADPAVIRTGFVNDVERYYRAMDVAALPTYREGFGTVLLEAQCSGVPVVTTNATGAADAILDGETGLRVPVGDIGALASALDRLLSSADLRTKMSSAGRAWVEKSFRAEDLWREILAHYKSLLMTCRDDAPSRSQSGNPLSLIFKNACDRSLAAIMLIILSPLFVALVCMIRLRIGRPILFQQARIGFLERPFKLIKFRTMTEACDSNGVLVEDALRLTPFGQLLRAWSLDELPQLWNVLRGEMSLVGPRPLPAQYLPRYNPRQRRRHEVKPGVTGWAQVNGRNGLSWEEKFNFDVWYVDHRSLWLDGKILCSTMFKIFRREGINQPGHTTMPEFMGTANIRRGHE
jgi:lipopolysaccharide/colanic/teichoic acid biosynthesis glycosyltransferase